MGTFQISIPKPCHENWATMSPREKGRFCDKCSKTVLDFTAKTPEEIEEYILLHENEKLCGRFMHRQIINPVRVEVSFPFFVNRLNSITDQVVLTEISRQLLTAQTLAEITALQPRQN